ncbi:Retrovirus-related Pol polyprotein from transposon 17.6 [Dictyocoela muelleri]|nr:Retrovirus-related Pol polyprotein from transposon 17.6 [Dictyocoela muelleri]
MDNKTYALREQTTQPKIIEIPMTLENKKIEAIIDTGSVENYVTEKNIKDINAEPTELDNAKKVELANGNIIEVRKSINLLFKLQEDAKNSYKSKFYVMSNHNTYPILGMRFLTENDAVINLNEGFVTIDGTEYEIDTKTQNLCVAEKKIIEKSKVYAINDYENKIKDLIKFNKKRNPILGNIPNILHHIELNSPFEKIEKEYSVPLGLEKDVKSHLEELLSNKIIEEVDSPILSPAFAIKKKNGKIRLVVDYRYLNSITKKAHQITPNMFELISKLNGSKIFSLIDLKQGYYQINIAPDDIFKTGFKILNRKFVFNKMPFGLCNASSTFQSAMNSLFKDTCNVLVYLDDILIYSNNLESHYKTLSEVFDIINKNSISINFEKCQFCLEKVCFLGHEIDSNGIKPLTSKIDGLEIKPPKTKKQLEKILGLLNWFRPFIENLSGMTCDFYENLKSKDKKIMWTKNDTDKLEMIFKTIKKTPTLHHVDLNKEFILKCDASEKAIGALLTQDGKLVVIFSNKYNTQEINYSNTEKEALAISKAFLH